LIKARSSSLLMLYGCISSSLLPIFLTLQRQRCKYPLQSIHFIYSYVLSLCICTQHLVWKSYLHVIILFLGKPSTDFRWILYLFSEKKLLKLTRITFLSVCYEFSWNWVSNLAIISDVRMPVPKEWKKKWVPCRFRSLKLTNKICIMRHNKSPNFPEVQ
jgi:hypothetical protein